MKATDHSRSRAFSAGKAAVVLLALLCSLPAWARSYHISKFNSNIHVAEDGSARIEEQITFVFSGEYHGIYRDIPVDYPGPSGSNYTLFIKLGPITDESGDKLKVEKKTSGGFLHLKIYVPGATNATRTVSYTPTASAGSPAMATGTALLTACEAFGACLSRLLGNGHGRF